METTARVARCLSTLHDLDSLVMIGALCRLDLKCRIADIPSFCEFWSYEFAAADEEQVRCYPCCHTLSTDLCLSRNVYFLPRIQINPKPTQPIHPVNVSMPAYAKTIFPGTNLHVSWKKMKQISFSSRQTINPFMYRRVIFTPVLPVSFYQRGPTLRPFACPKHRLRWISFSTSYVQYAI